MLFSIYIVLLVRIILVEVKYPKRQKPTLIASTQLFLEYNAFNRKVKHLINTNKRCAALI